MNKIFIIYTGGTIGMVRDAQSGSFIPFDFALIEKNLPDLHRLDYKITVHSFDHIIDSSNMNEGIWLQMARLIRDNYEDYDGFVILHGSDTMAFSASILSFLLEGLQKPVILSGSQLSIGEVRSDARENILTALEIATAKEKGRSIVQEVCILFNNKLFRGNRAFKYHAEKFEAFRSPNYPLLAEAGIHIRFDKNVLLNNSGRDFIAHDKIDNSVGVLKLYPGIGEKSIRSILNAEVKSIVLESFGTGNTMTYPWFHQALESAVQSGKNIVNITQCKVGSVEMGMYETSRKLHDIGVLNGRDMTFEATITKLMYLQGLHSDQKEVAHWVEKDIRGEITL